MAHVIEVAVDGKDSEWAHRGSMTEVAQLIFSAGDICPICGDTGSLKYE